MWRFRGPALLVLTAGLCLAAGGSRCAGQAEYDAAFVRMDVPEKVVAGQVFQVTIVLRNTGTKPWPSEQFRLRTVEPQDNLSWGAGFIILRQGSTVAPGGEAVYRSFLKAPAAPGKVGFRWQVVRDGKVWFGEMTPPRTLQVDPRPAEPPATAPAVDPRRRHVLAFDDFEYAGSFKPPRVVAGARGAFSECGIALRKMKDGSKRLLMNFTHPEQVLFEMEVPPLAKVEEGKHAGLPGAALKRVWGKLHAGEGEEAISANGGILWDEAKSTLYWTYTHGYKTGNAPPVLAASKLAEDGTVTTSGPWYVKPPSGLWKAYWGGITRLPRAFADKYAGGRTLALGFGGYYSIVAPASRGPALGAIPEPGPGTRALDVLELLVYPHAKPAPRDGDYLNANCGYWAEQAESPTKGFWTYDDSSRAGVFVDAPDGHAFIAFAQLGTGRMGYDFGAITSAGHEQCWYCYDPEELGQAAKGEKRPGEVLPRTVAKVQYPLGGPVTGACYDGEEKLLYLCCAWAYPEGLESYPVINVYRVK